MQEENEFLKENLLKLKEVAKDETFEKQKYMEGAVWMGQRMSNEVERACKVFEQLSSEYKQRFQEYEKESAG